MAVPFDHIASAYDSIFTRSAVGQLQRKHVWKYIETVVPHLKGFEMLELNCGSGDDALMFGEGGSNLVATDISQEMLKITLKNSEQYSLQSRITSQYLDIESFDETIFDKKFDLVFSNFGGINCINPKSLKKLLNTLPKTLNPGGRFIGVVMPKFCAWETVFFMFRFQFRKAFRRFTSREVSTNVNGTSVKAWYYHPSQIRRWSRQKFKLISIRPVGVALPPSYLENFFTLKRRWLLRLNNYERKLADLPLLSGMADHFVIDLQLR